MYHISNKQEPIKEVQIALFALGYGESHLVPIDGIFGENTRNAILHFQQENGLIPSGVVDYETFIQLKNKKIEVEKGANIFPFPLKEGDNNEKVAHLHAALNILFTENNNGNNPLTGTLFDSQTKKYVNLFLLRIGAVENGEITMAQYERLQKEGDISLLYNF